MPISWKGTLAQYVGRLHRQHAGKTEVIVVNYVDEAVPMLVRMATKRRTGYPALGYTIESYRSWVRDQGTHHNLANLESRSTNAGMTGGISPLRLVRKCIQTSDRPGTR